MAHYAKIDENNIVVQVIVAEESVINSFDNPDEWIQTSYNTHRGVHSAGETPLRKNFAGIGYTYDTERDAFYSPKPFNSWTLDESSCTWEPPIERPNDDKIYSWNETDQTWDEVEA
jgi:hypothetical protein